MPKGGKKGKGQTGSPPASSQDTVNPQITDAVTETSVSVVGEAPAAGIGSLYQTIGNSVAMAAANAVTSQQQTNVSYQATSTIGVAKLLGLPV